MRKIPLYWQILAAILLAVLCGILLQQTDAATISAATKIFTYVGSLFLNALKMLIVPLVFSSIICGVSSVGGDGEQIGKLTLKTVGFYFFTSLIAILVGLVMVNLIQPGIIDGQSIGEALNLVKPDQSATLEKLSQDKASLTSLFDIFLRMLPPNIIAAAANGQMLGLIVFAMIFGFFITTIPSALNKTQSDFWQGVFEIMMQMTMLVMKFAPLGVFALVAKTIMTTGLEIFDSLLLFFLCVVTALAIHAFVSLFLILKYVAKVNPLKHYKIMSPVLLTAFSTASSSATLPLTIDTLRQEAGVSNKTSAFVLPLGATVNMDGTALYECVAAIFIAQVYGLELTFVHQFIIVITALLTSIGVAGVPAASLVAISIILSVMGLPLEGIGLLMVTDRLLDMLRTAVNVFSDSVCAIVIARLEGEQTNLC